MFQIFSDQIINNLYKCDYRYSLNRNQHCTLNQNDACKCNTC